MIGSNSLLLTIKSALVFKLLSDICPEKIIPIYFSNLFNHDINLRCGHWFDSISEVIRVPLRDSEVARYSYLCDLAKGHNAWIASSRNATEQYLGTYSTASRVCTYYPILNVFKTEVITACNMLGIPDEIINSSRKADPNCGRPQEMADIELEEIDKCLGLFYIGYPSIDWPTAHRKPLEFNTKWIKK